MTDRRLSPREIEDAFRWLMESPRKKPLEILIVLVSLFWFLQLWLIERILELRSRSRQSPMCRGQSRGGAKNDDGARMSDETFSEVQNVESPPSEAPPFPVHIGEACNPWLIVRRRRK